MEYPEQVRAAVMQVSGLETTEDRENGEARMWEMWKSSDWSAPRATPQIRGRPIREGAILREESAFFAWPSLLITKVYPSSMQLESRIRYKADISYRQAIHELQSNVPLMVSL
jgi:hypothetical protein